MEADSLTQTLAVWGAITGTIGTIAGIANLVIRLKQHKKDQPKLKCASDFSFEHSSGSVSPKHKLILRSIGKRPVTVDHIRYFIKPKAFWQRVLKKWIWSNNRWIYDDKPRNTIHITEGRKEELKISMPNGISIPEVLKVEIYDQTGKAWSVKWPSPKKLAVLVHHEQLHESEDSNDSRLCKVSGYAASDSYHIYAHWNPTPKSKNSFKGRFFHFNNFNEYQAKLKDILEIQKPKLLACEIEEIT